MNYEARQRRLDRAHVLIRTELTLGFLASLLTGFLYIGAPGYMMPFGEPTLVDRLMPAAPVVSFVAWLWMLRLSRPNPEAGEPTWRYRAT
jgi:hypothetical protein